MQTDAFGLLIHHKLLLHTATKEKENQNESALVFMPLKDLRGYKTLPHASEEQKRKLFSACS